ncbi:hypothetical protein DFH27DRAFT_651676 [Peziza echinospora]|nr:hypothetical protein DFH27DRAFT_651676 [Peziza echinospora]
MDFTKHLECGDFPAICCEKEKAHIAVKGDTNMDSLFYGNEEGSWDEFFGSTPSESGNRMDIDNEIQNVPGEPEVAKRVETPTHIPQQPTISSLHLPQATAQDEILPPPLICMLQPNYRVDADANLTPECLSQVPPISEAHHELRCEAWAQGKSPREATIFSIAAGTRTRQKPINEAGELETSPKSLPAIPHTTIYHICLSAISDACPFPAGLGLPIEQSHEFAQGEGQIDGDGCLPLKPQLQPTTSVICSSPHRSRIADIPASSSPVTYDQFIHRMNASVQFSTILSTNYTRYGNHGPNTRQTASPQQHTRCTLPLTAYSTPPDLQSPRSQPFTTEHFSTILSLKCQSAQTRRPPITSTNPVNSMLPTPHP